MTLIKIGYQDAEPGYGSAVLDVVPGGTVNTWHIRTVAPRRASREFIVERDGVTLTCFGHGRRCIHVEAVRNLLAGVGVQ